MKAIILAAGRGSRLMPYTENIPKCLIDFKGKTFLEYQLKTLYSAGIKNIIIVTGYRSDKIKTVCKYFEQKKKDVVIKIFNNYDYVHSGTLNSMSLARDHFTEDLIVLNSDILFTKKCLLDIISCPNICVTMENGRWENKATCIQVDQTKVVSMGFLSQIESSGLSVGIVKFPLNIMHEVKNFLTDYPADTKSFVFNLINHFIEKNHIVNYSLCEFNDWCEIDTPEDLKLYKNTIKKLLK